MKTIAEYEGNLLNHVEALYRPGERELAVALAQALGCAISDTGFSGDGDETFLAIHPNPEDRNLQNNAFYISPMRPEQQALETHLRDYLSRDDDLGERLEAYRNTARTKPFGVPHFALRYRSGKAIEEAMDRVRDDLGARLGDRLHLRIFRPGDADAAVGQVVQAFIYQDVIVSGSFLMGQLIELQSEVAVATAAQATAPA